jgi:hypothetical protein
MLLERSNQKHVVQRKLASIDKDFSSSVFLQVGGSSDCADSAALTLTCRL